MSAWPSAPYVAWARPRPTPAYDLATAITSQTRVIALARPHDPTGAPIDTRTLEAIADVAERARIHVLADEVYPDTLGGALVAPAPAPSQRLARRPVADLPRLACRAEVTRGLEGLTAALDAVAGLECAVR